MTPGSFSLVRSFVLDLTEPPPSYVDCLLNVQRGGLLQTLLSPVISLSTEKAPGVTVCRCRTIPNAIHHKRPSSSMLTKSRYSLMSAED